MTDTVLWNKWRTQRDAEAFRELASRYSGMVYATCLRVLHNPHEAEEVAQDCFEKLATAPKIAAPHLGPWLHKVATNSALDRLRREERRRVREDRYAREHDGAHQFEWNDIYPLVDEAIAELPEDLRVPLVLHFLENQTHDAISQGLAVPRATVTYRIQRALDRVRLTLKRRGVDVGATVLATMLGTRLAEAAVAPAALQAALGRIAMAGLKATPVAAAGGSTLLGGLTAKLLLGAAAAVVTLGLAWNALAPQTPAPPPAASTAQAQPVETPKSARPAQYTASAPTPAPAAAPATPQAAPEGGVITGRIFNSKTGQGIAGMHVYADYGEHSCEAVSTDADGVFRFTGLAAGAYRVRPGHNVDGYSRRGFKKIDTTVVPGKPVAGVDFAIAPSIPVSGRVVSADGKPVSDAQVGVIVNGLSAAERAQSRADGSFTVNMPEPGANVQIQARHEGVQSLLTRHDSLGPEGLSGVKLALTEPLTAGIEGKLLLPDGSPAAGYPLHLNSGMMAFLVDITGGQTRPDGTFRIEKLAAGTYQVIFSRPGEKSWFNANSVGEVTVGTGQTLTGLVLRIQPEQEGLSISGRVVDKAGKGIAGAFVATSGKGDSCSATADERGAFVIHGLKEGSYYVEARPAGTLHSPAVVRDVAAGTQGLDIVLVGVGRIEGHLLDARNGLPIPRFETYLCPIEQAESRPNELFNRQEVNNPDGRFVREQVGAGTQSLTIRAPGYAPVHQVVEVKENQTVACPEFRLKPAAALTGRVVDEGGKPVADVGIYLSSLKAWTSTEEPLARSTTDGTFSIEGLPPQVTKVFAYHLDYPPVQVGVDQLDPIVLPIGGTVEGRITVNGQPVEGCRISANDLPRFNFTNSKLDGSYRLAAIAPGTVGLTAWLVNDGGRRLTREVTVEAGATATLDFDFPAVDARVEGLVTQSNAPVAGANLTLTVESEGHKETLQGQTDESGHYAFANVTHGHANLMLLATQPDHEPLLRRARFDVEAGAAVIHDIEVDAPGKITGQVAGLTGDSVSVILLLAPGTALPERIDKAVFQEMVSTEAFAIASCKPDGSFEMPNVAPGDYLALALIAPKADPADFTEARVDSATVHVDEAPVTLNLAPR